MNATDTSAQTWSNYTYETTSSGQDSTQTAAKHVWNAHTARTSAQQLWMRYYNRYAVSDLSN
jgi:hypothetical protein